MAEVSVQCIEVGFWKCYLKGMMQFHLLWDHVKVSVSIKSRQLFIMPVLKISAGFVYLCKQICSCLCVELFEILNRTLVR